VERRRVVSVVLTVAFVALAMAPAVVVFSAGWLSAGSHSPAGDASDRTPEAWVVFTLFYLLWMLGLTIGLITINDRRGLHWRSWDRSSRPEKKRRRRLAAGMKYLEGQEEARAEAGRDPARAARRTPRLPRDQDHS